MSSKGIDALRAQRKTAGETDPCAMALRVVNGAGFALPDAWCHREGGGSLVVEFTGWTSLQLRTDAHDFGTWSLWFAGTRLGLFRTPAEALAVAKARGFLHPTKEKKST